MHKAPGPLAEVCALESQGIRLPRMIKRGLYDIIKENRRGSTGWIKGDEQIVKTYAVSDIQSALQRMPMDQRVRRLILFGSHAKGTARPHSDLDLYLDSNGLITGFDYFALKASLEDAFGRDIDLLPDVDVLPNSKVAQEIAKYGVMVYARQ